MVTISDADKVSFRVYMPDARDVCVVGTFTGWRDGAVPMTRGEGGWWTCEIDLGSGEHEFQYLVDGAHWLADYAAGGLRLNRYGTWVSQLHIAPAEERTYSFEAMSQTPQRLAA
ncbi:MAG: hypothetical protein J0L61_10320 [Planctomycetes bacterium]|nr:hypothetical protein [Planctomycetota bacterium]